MLTVQDGKPTGARSGAGAKPREIEQRSRVRALVVLPTTLFLSATPCSFFEQDFTLFT